MVLSAVAVDWTVVATEVEALQLEYNWIKEFDPRFNVRYRDDKSYPSLAVTLYEEYPQLRVMRGPKRKGVRYFGPYSHAWAIRETLDLLLRVFPARTCSGGVFKRAGQVGRPCLLGYIDKCSAPCVGRVSASEHRRIVEEFCDFMAGSTTPYLKRLRRQMDEASQATEYERAARLRDDVRALERALEKQAVVLGDGTDADVIGIAEDPLEAAVQVFHVRGGRVRGQRGMVVDKVEDVTRRGRRAILESRSAAVQRRTADQRRRVLERRRLGCARGEALPRVLVTALPPADSPVQEWLERLRGGRVELRVPRRGDKRALLDTVERNAAQAFTQHKLRRASDLTARSRALSQLQEALGLAEAPLRIECFDVSNLQGDNVVASMVVFEDGLARKSEYRRFEIRGVGGQDDVASLREAVTRRFRRYLDERVRTGDLAPDGDDDGGHNDRYENDRCQVRLPSEPGGRGRRWAAGGRGPAGAGGARHRRRGCLRAGQAHGGGVVARLQDDPVVLSRTQRGSLPSPAGPGRGPPLRDHLSPAEAVQDDGCLRTGRRTRAGGDPQARPASSFRFAEAAARRVRQGDRLRARGGAAHRRGRRGGAGQTGSRAGGERDDGRGV